jgi:hypothetical protein
MILSWFKQRRAVRIEALQLIDAHGPHKAWAMTYARSRQIEGSPAELQHALLVRRRVEKLTGIRLGVDTATRYLQK